MSLLIELDMQNGFVVPDSEVSGYIESLVPLSKEHKEVMICMGSPLMFDCLRAYVRHGFIKHSDINLVVSGEMHTLSDKGYPSWRTWPTELNTLQRCLRSIGSKNYKPKNI